MKATLTKIDVLIGSRTVSSVVGSYMVVETKEAGVISLVDAEHGLNVIITGYPDDWGGEVQNINVSTEKGTEKTLPKELKGLQVIQLKEKHREIDVPDDLVGDALGLAKLKAQYELAQNNFKKQHLATLKSVIGRLHSSKGDRPIGGRK